MGEHLVEMHLAVEAGEQNLAQRDATCGAVLLDRLRVAGYLQGKQFLHLFRQKAEATVSDAAGGGEGFEEWGRQTVMERAAALRTDVDAVALEPVGAGAVALIDRDAQAGFHEALRESEATDAPSDDADVKAMVSHGRPPGT